MHALLYEHLDPQDGLQLPKICKIHIRIRKALNMFHEYSYKKNTNYSLVLVKENVVLNVPLD